MSFFKQNLSDFFNICADTLFLNEHTQLIKWFKLKKTSVKALLIDHAQLKNKTKLKKKRPFYMSFLKYILLIF